MHFKGSFNYEKILLARYKKERIAMGCDTAI